MSVSAEQLAQHFDGLSDDELLSRWRSGGLTELAQAVADAEVRKRGLDAAAPAPAAVAVSVPTEPASAEPAELASDPSDLVTVFRTYNALEAHALLGRLQAEGIPASIADVQTGNQLPIAVGGVRLQASSEHAARARALVADFRAGRLALPDEAPSPPEPSVEAQDRPALWSPDAAAVLSWFFFTSVFGALVHAANWRRLGESDRAVNSLLWAAAAIASFMIVGSYGAIQHKPQTFLLYLAHLLNTLAWYFLSGRKQSKYLVAVLKGNYERRGWFNPVCVAIIVLGLVLGLAR